MIDAANFIVRISGRRQNSCYIDYKGLYKLSDISKEGRIDALKLEEIYLANGGTKDNELDIYYFDNIISAKKAITDIYSKMRVSAKGRSILFTETEIEYIRKALINDSGNIGVNNRVKDSIFKKLNG